MSEHNTEHTPERNARLRPHLTRLHHAQITIPKGAEAEARAFYCDLLGLREVEKPDSLKGRGGFWVEIGDVQVHIGTEDGIDRAATKAHLAYQVEMWPRGRPSSSSGAFLSAIASPSPASCASSSATPSATASNLSNRCKTANRSS